ncbi:sensor histidine kinase [Kribbella albertanoniae]|uniref:sensor histidine kinase n=1 Tax=Kribbella albertanoniae TaxID=1266829 RepID=UPI0014045AEF|nr:histidine kinase [Kribbella albertanoniae]
MSRLPVRLPARQADKADGWSVDVFFVVVTAAVNLAGVLSIAGHSDTWGSFDALGLFLLLAGPVALWWRRRWPAFVLAVCVVATWSYLATDNPSGPVYGPMIVALVSAITNGARAAAYLVVIGTLLTSLVGVLLPGSDGPSLASTAGLAAWLSFLLALGELLRHRSALAKEQQRRLVMAAEAQTGQIRREAAEQRLKLARDLHDVLGHHLAVINVQATAGLQLHTTNRPGVPDALAAVQEASRQALDDVQAFLDTLHDPTEPATRTPSPSLVDLETLVSSARASGLQVQLEVSGPPRRLAAPQDLAASRVVLESLTNVLRHAGPARTWVRIHYQATRLTVRVDNAHAAVPAGPSPYGGGRGIAGMRARVAALDGTFAAGPADGFAWSVIATLPLPEELP